MNAKQSRTGSDNTSSGLGVDGTGSRENLTVSCEDDYTCMPSLPLPSRSHAMFVNKLYNMVEDPSIQNLISWSESGHAFFVYDPSAFSRILLPRYFKHSNWQSFVRQLNMYGFSKVNDEIYSSPYRDNQIWVFRHPHFRKGTVGDLVHIKRKSATRFLPVTMTVSEEHDKSAALLQLPEDMVMRTTCAISDYSNLQGELASLREMVSSQQEAMRSMIDTLKILIPPASTADQHNFTDRKSSSYGKLLAIEAQLQMLSSPIKGLQPEDDDNDDEPSSSLETDFMLDGIPPSPSLGTPRPSSAFPCLSPTTNPRTRTTSTIMRLGSSSALLNPAPSNNNKKLKRYT